MKKKVLIIILIILLALGITAGVFVVILNQEKESITAQEFYDEMEDDGYLMADVTSQFDAYGDYVDVAYVAIKGDYQIEFYELSSEANAKSMFAQNKNTFENSAGSSRAKSSYGFKNYNIFSMTSNGEYMYLSRIDDTLIYLRVDEKHKAEVKEIIDELDY